MSREVLIALLQFSDLGTHLSNLNVEVLLFLEEGDVFSLQTFEFGVKAGVFALLLVEVGFLLVDLLDELVLLVLEVFNRLLFVSLVVLQLLDGGLVLRDVLQQLVLLGIPRLLFSLILDLLFFEFVDLVLLLLKLFLLLHEITVKLDNFLVESSFGELQIVNLLLLGLDLLLKLLLLSDELVDGVVLTK